MMGGVASAVADPKGNITTYAYTAYGDLMPSSPTLKAFGYNAENTDYNTGLQYLRARYYNTKTGRFISKDEYRGDFTQPSTLNRYAYCAGNPVNRIDPSGYSWLTVLWGVIKNLFSSNSGEAPVSPSAVTPIEATGINQIDYSGNDEQIQDEKDEGESEVLVIDSIWKPLDSKWSYRIDPANEGTGTKRHIHFKKGDDTNWQSENADGSGHDSSKGKKVPKRVKKKASDKGIWNPKKKSAEENAVKINQQAINTAIGAGIVIVATIGVAVLVADDATGIGAVDDPLIVPVIGLLAKGLQMITS